ncbi:HNH endonuclease signature motif containing protein [Nitrosopumilus sp.]|uniref:HNH endonuclease signature motif containing protein n=1 Tax=Nitrosopumilus sp. TaxID=2024843 RepID=UPI0034A081B5
MGFFKKTDYEKHAEKLHNKLSRIIKTMDSRELKDICQKVIGKYPREGTRLFDSEYNLIQKFGYKISHTDYMLYFSHYRIQGKFSDLKLAKYLIMRDILDKNDPDYEYLKQFAKSEDQLDYQIPRNNFPATVKEAIRKIQHNRCAIPHCTNTEYFEFDHIKGRDDNTLSNCQMLCKFHHQMKSNEDAIKKRIEENLKDGGTVRDIHIKSRPSQRRSPSRKTSRRTPHKSNSRRHRR